jgi:FAD binding domain
MDKGDLWFFMPTGIQSGLRLIDTEAAHLIRQATGIDHPIEILSADEWVASQLIADRYRDHRVFLIGDACHLHPPFGGYGMNMGISDGVDLGWKIAATLAGWGGPRLLDSYEAERRQIHREVIDEAVANHSVLSNQLWREGLENDSPDGAKLREEVGGEITRSKLREFKSLGIVLGSCYGDSPVIAHEYRSGNRGRPSAVYVPSAEPGCLAPHLWLESGVSLHDLFGPGFTLLANGALEREEESEIKADAAACGIPLTIVQLTDERLSALYEARLALIRPDQHVAWRGPRWPGARVLDLTTGW